MAEGESGQIRLFLICGKVTTGSEPGARDYKSNVLSGKVLRNKADINYSNIIASNLFHYRL